VKAVKTRMFSQQLDEQTAEEDGIDFERYNERVNREKVQADIERFWSQSLKGM